MGTYQTIVFDYDHTLTSWDSSDRFFRWLLTRGSWRIVLIKNTRKLPIKFAVWMATLGRSNDTICALAKIHVAEIVARRQPLYLQDAIRQLNHHLEQGHRVVVATGLLEVLAREFLDQSGLAHIPLVGSSLKLHMWGLVAHEHCHGPGKIPMLLTQRGYPPPWVATYTDHECDLPVIGQSAECCLVNPRPKAIQIITDKLPFTPVTLL